MPFLVPACKVQGCYLRLMNRDTTLSADNLNRCRQIFMLIFYAEWGKEHHREARKLILEDFVFPLYHSVFLLVFAYIFVYICASCVNFTCRCWSFGFFPLRM